MESQNIQSLESSTGYSFIDNTNNKIKTFTCFKTERIYPQCSEVGGLVVTILLIITPSLVFMVFALMIGIKHYKDSITLLIVSILSFIVSFITLFLALYSLWDISTSIPGYQEEPQKSSTEYKQEQPFEIIKNIRFELKYCDTCRIVRHVRTFHCKICNKCIENHDHHCGFVANCIGKANLKKFFFFLGGVATHCITIISFSIYYVCTVLITMKNIIDNSWMYSFGLVGFFAGIFLLVTGGMFLEFIYNISCNRTTNEKIRKKYDNSVFDNGCRENWREVWNA